jgi:hypothetical protein
MVRCLPLAFCFVVLALTACGKSSTPALPPEPLEPLFNTNTVCYESYTFDLHGFGDSTRLAEADTSYLVIHGLTDTLVGTTSGPAWLALAADGWSHQKDQWRRIPSDSIEVGFTHASSRHEFRLALHEEAATGVGREFAKTLKAEAVPAIDEWDMVLSRIHCSGLREPVRTRINLPIQFVLMSKSHDEVPGPPEGGVGVRHW